jgi:hypothetical protein
MKLFMLFVVLILVFTNPLPSVAQNYTQGTAIFAIRTPDEIVVAADSRVVGANGLPSFTPVCKIRQISSFFVAAYGLYEERQTGYNLWEIIKQVSRGFNTLSTMADSFESSLRSPFEKALKYLRFADPGFYKEKCIKRSPMGVILGGIENNIIVLKHRKVTVYDPASANIWINFIKEDCPGSGCAEGYIAIAVAEDPEDASFSQSKEALKSGGKNMIDLAKNFVANVISRNPINYGPPIDIISLNKEGLKWIQKKGECVSKD